MGDTVSAVWAEIKAREESCHEIFKLKQLLENEKILFDWQEFTNEYCSGDGMIVSERTYQITYPIFEQKYRRISVMGDSAEKFFGNTLKVEKWKDEESEIISIRSSVEDAFKIIKLHWDKTHNK